MSIKPVFAYRMQFGIVQLELLFLISNKKKKRNGSVAWKTSVFPVFLKTSLLYFLSPQDNQPVQLDDRIQILNDGLQLKIMNASVSDTARYTCVARNPAGQDSLSFDLQVLGKLEFVISVAF